MISKRCKLKTDGNSEFIQTQGYIDLKSDKHMLMAI